jgi:hypothetical protein
MIGLMVIIIGKTGNEYFFEVKTRTNDVSVTYSTVIEKIKT